MLSFFLLFLLSVHIVHCQDNNNIDAIQQEDSIQNIQTTSNPQVIEINGDDLEDVLLKEADDPAVIEEDIAIDTNIIKNANNNDQIIPRKPTTKTKEPSTTRSSYAWVSMVDTNITSIIGARVLSQSLSKHQSKAARILICTPGISDKAVHMLRNFGWKIYLIDVNLFAKMKNYADDVKAELLKILMFNLTEYSSVGYLSPQSMVTTNIDHLFECGESAFCGTPNDKHYQIYEKHQRRSKKLLDAVSANIFDDNIYLMTPETDLYLDMFAFITSSQENADFPSYLSEYFYHYCKGNGYPISRQQGEYTAPKAVFNCSGDDECRISKQISKSPCYILEEGYNFHPSHNDHISQHWHWKQSMKHVSIKIIQYSSYFAHNNEYKPWKWRYVLFSGWMIQWNRFADVEPNLFYQFLLKEDEVILSLWQTPVLYFFFIIIFLSTLTLLSTPCFRMVSFMLQRVSTAWIIILYKWSICPLLLVWSAWIIVHPLHRVFVGDAIIPQTYPFISGWILAAQYCYFTSCFEFIVMCYVMYWCGNVYHPIQFKIKWFDYLQLQLFKIKRNRTKKDYYYDIESGYRGHGVSSNRGGVSSNRFMRMIFKCQDLSDRLQHIVFKYCSILVLIALKWCVSYLSCIVIVLWTIWILRFNDWYELKFIVGGELLICAIWLIYSSIQVYCQCFIYPQIKKFGEKYYDSDAFHKQDY
eukprot:226417_1